MEILLATNNAHKVEEMREIFKDHKILSPRDRNLHFDFEETGASFLENSLGKARALYEIAKVPVLADDSGLCVDILGGAPGIFSARYGSAPGGPELDSPGRNALLLETLKGKTPRSAHFVCALSLVLGKDRFYCLQETVEGEILESLRGAGGFGYDPLFYMPPFKKTMAELSPAEKNIHSHRAKAGAAMNRLLAGLEN